MLASELGMLIVAITRSLEKEARALRSRNLGAIAEVNEHKSRLIAALENAAGNLVIDDKAKNMISVLETLNKRAKENADQLRFIRQGFVDVRRRLDELEAGKRKTGLYAATGQELRNVGSTSGRNV